MSYKKEKIAGLEINLRTGMYQIRENKITYDFEFDMLINLKFIYDLIQTVSTAAFRHGIKA